MRPVRRREKCGDFRARIRERGCTAVLPRKNRKGAARLLFEAEEVKEKPRTNKENSEKYNNTYNKPYK